MGNIAGYLVLVTISVCVFLLVYLPTRKSLGGLLDAALKLPAGTTFYLRVYSILLLFIVLAAIADGNLDLEKDAKFMEYIWAIGANLATVFQYISFMLLGYVILITVLVAILKRQQ
ncbi:MAG: hypothetical protein A2166_06745 [Omnitrophica WOR_2 bacterium RBG_13_41_10]|nr:MAG: hypothetical protein A2166_06745 [Omnitrophica WOR_2 bacterium RBG_13_41_10]